MSESTPVELIVAAFRNERGADEALDALKQAKKEQLVKIKEAAVVRRDTNNRLHINEKGDLTTGGGAASGAAIGAIAGVFGGPIGIAIGGAVGAAIGGLAGKLIDSGIPDVRLKQIGAALQPGTSAIVALIEHSWVDELSAALRQAGGDLLTQSITADIATQLAAGRDVAYSALSSGGAVIAGRVAEDEQRTDVAGIAASAEGVVAGAFTATKDAAAAAAEQAGATLDTAVEATQDAAADTVEATQDAAAAVVDTTQDAAAAVVDATQDAAAAAADSARDAMKKLAGDKS